MVIAKLIIISIITLNYLIINGLTLETRVQGQQKSYWWKYVKSNKTYSYKIRNR